MKKVTLGFFVLVFILGAFVAGWFVREKDDFLKKNETDTNTTSKEPARPLEKYTIENLTQKSVPHGDFSLVSKEKGGESFDTSVVSLSFFTGL